MQLPRTILIGNNILDKIGEVCKEFGFKNNALILSGPETYKVVGKRVKNILESYGLHVENLIVEESKLKYVNDARDVAKKLKPQVILGVGGGKVIDVAKYCAFLEDTPFISVPTAASHDGISSPRASIKDSQRPTSIEAKSPLAIVADIDIIAQAPPRLMASGCGDIIAKYTAVRDWKLSHKIKGEYYGAYTGSLVMMSAFNIIKNADVIRNNPKVGYRIILEALIGCGIAMGIAGSSRPCSGSEHLFSHALDILAPKPALHGEQCGVGTIMMSYLHKANWNLVRDTLEKIGAPTSAKTLGIAPKYIIKALTYCNKIRPDSYTILGENGLSENEARALAEKTFVI
jgi:glycerol-1-phosphate dehydrogenase [NAD(P)+]